MTVRLLEPALRLYRRVRLERTNVQRLLLWLAVALFLVTAAAGIVVDDPVLAQLLTVYTAPLLLLAPLWLRLRVAELPPAPDRALLVDAAAFGLAFLRFATGNALPFSGHMLFLTYSFLVTRNGAYRAAAAIGLAGTTFFKFVIWDGRLNWAAGLLLGIGGALLHARAAGAARARALARAREQSLL